MSEVGASEGKSMRLKKGVRIFGLRPELTLALFICEQVYRDANTELVITSVIDGKHSVGSLHYTGSAVDLRIRDFPAGQAGSVRDQIAERLGNDFDAVLERDHIHLEFQPKLSYERN